MRNTTLLKTVALTVSLLALTTPSNGQGFLKKLKDAANNATEKVNTAGTMPAQHHQVLWLCRELQARHIMCPAVAPTKMTDSVLQQR